jgi:acyl-coenzyme A thioesterase PaaI-like protein
VGVDEADPREGFVRHTRRSGLTEPWEPIYYKKWPGTGVSLAIRAARAHANSRGFVHGGLMSVLADNAMGLACGEALAATRADIAGLLTVNLALDFAGSAKMGQWLEIRSEIIKAGGSLCFASALVFADDTVCARASAVFKVLAGADQ